VSEGVYALFGVIVGALSTGAVQFALDARARRRAARVSARLLLNSLEQYDHATRRVLHYGTWPSHPQWFELLNGLSSPWQEHQHVLAEIRSFAAWVDVANAFIEARERVVFSGPVGAGEPLDESDREGLEELLESLERTRIVVARLGMSRWQRLRVLWRTR
jgi:hypothetical protein